MYSFKNYLLVIYFVQGTTLSLGYILVKKMDTVPALRELED